LQKVIQDFVVWNGSCEVHWIPVSRKKTSLTDTSSEAWKVEIRDSMVSICSYRIAYMGGVESEIVETNGEPEADLTLRTSPG
jgi:hypothetical protein